MDTHVVFHILWPSKNKYDPMRNKKKEMPYSDCLCRTVMTYEIHLEELPSTGLTTTIVVTIFENWSKVEALIGPTVSRDRP